MPSVNLPPGCAGFTTERGETIRAKAGTKADLTDDQFARLRRSDHAKIGMISVDGATTLATKNGRVCPACHFRAQAWSHTCPKCGTPTNPE